jgi:mitogen-activated protein kinase 1/3
MSVAADDAKKEKKSKKVGGTHAFEVDNCKFVIDSYYQPLKKLGHGAYGVVCSAMDTKNNVKVAIKKVQGTFDDLIDGKRILREVKLLRHFQHENICGLLDLAPSPASVPFDDLYIVMDFMETDLHKIIYSKNTLTDEHIQYFTYQILKGLKYIHSANVLHRDLKPSNLLLNSNCDLKICDFGLARGFKSGGDNEWTEYVVTRWYRAPEVMCSCQDYSTGIDVWSVGCILAELHGRKPLFPGENYVKQMNLIFSVLGTPEPEDYDFITNEKALSYIKSLEKRPKQPFNQLYSQASSNAVDLMERMLQFNPKKRITVNEALAHPYFEKLHDPETEPECKQPFDFQFEQVKMTKPILQSYMLEEIYHFRPEERAKREAAGTTSKDKQ